jgi:site-specific recombinase XerC
MAEKVGDIKLVSPKLITRFIASELRRGGIPTKYVSFVSTFFDWMIAEDRFDHANPVVPRIHHAKTPKHLPRPYSEEEMTETVFERYPMATISKPFSKPALIRPRERTQA